MNEIKKVMLIGCIMLSGLMHGPAVHGEGNPGRYSYNATMFNIYPDEYTGALCNPLKGFRPDLSGSRTKEYAAIVRHYIRWNEIENDEGDTVQKIKDYCDKKWAGIEQQGIKVIPRVYLNWDRAPGNEYWPADMQAGDYSSEEFKQRLVRLIKRLGECWDNDPRVAWVQMGIIGQWGEHHSPSPTSEIETLMGDAFTASFTHKKFLVRHADEFTNYHVGIYWDSWAHIDQMETHGKKIENLNKMTERWKTAPIEGEVAYDWGGHEIQPGSDPNDTLSDPKHRKALIDTIRNLHCTGLGWVANYDGSDAAVRAGAEEVQKAFGYRFVVSQMSCSRRAEPDGTLRVAFVVENTGSAPFYEDWPVEFSLLDPETHLPVWKTVLDGVDIRDWLPGDKWDTENEIYSIPAERYVVKREILLPAENQLRKGKYIAALSVLDPIGMQPALRLAVKNYLTGGRCAIGYVGIGTDIGNMHALNPAVFADPRKDVLSYALPADGLRGHAGVPTVAKRAAAPEK